MNILVLLQIVPCNIKGSTGLTLLSRNPHRYQQQQGVSTHVPYPWLTTDRTGVSGKYTGTIKFTEAYLAALLSLPLRLKVLFGNI